MLTLTTIFYGVALFCNIIVCAVSVIFFIFSLKHCIKNGKFDFIGMFKNFFVFSAIALISFIPKHGLLKVLNSSSADSVSYEKDKKIKSLQRKKGNVYLEHLKKNDLNKTALK